MVIGIAVIEVMDRDGYRVTDHFYPYVRGANYLYHEDLEFEHYTDKEGYAGICDENNIGIPLIFHVNNPVDYLKIVYGKFHDKINSITLSGMSKKGMIILPVEKDEFQEREERKGNELRNEMIDAAKAGDIEAMEQLTLEDMELGRRTKKGRTVKVSPAYIKCLRIILGQIRNYQKETHRKLGLDDMTMETRNSLVGYWKERGLMPNAINSYMTDVRTVARAAYEDKLTKCDDFRHSDFVPKKEDVDNIYLTPEQIQEMLDLDLSTKEAVKERLEALEIREDEKLAQLSKCRITHIRTLEHVRDIFIVGCLTGQRVSDYSRICEDMITEIGGTEFILLTQQKTEKKVYIPVDRRVRAILTKYNGTLPHVGPNEMNKLVKTIGLLLGWTHDCGFDEKRLNPKRGRRFCDMLLSHTARRSFATNAYKAGVPLSSIQAITGHSSEAQLRRYLKLDAEEKAVIALRDFKGIIEV